MVQTQNPKPPIPQLLIQQQVESQQISTHHAQREKESESPQTAYRISA